MSAAIGSALASPHDERSLQARRRGNIPIRDSASMPARRIGVPRLAVFQHARVAARMDDGEAFHAGRDRGAVRSWFPRPDPLFRDDAGARYRGLSQRDGSHNAVALGRVDCRGSFT
jgi:hypothetical protein